MFYFSPQSQSLPSILAYFLFGPKHFRLHLHHDGPNHVLLGCPKHATAIKPFRHSKLKDGSLQSKPRYKLYIVFRHSKLKDGSLQSKPRYKLYIVFRRSKLKGGSLQSKPRYKLYIVFRRSKLKGGSLQSKPRYKLYIVFRHSKLKDGSLQSKTLQAIRFSDEPKYLKLIII